MTSPLPGWGINVTAHDINSSNIEWLLDCIQDLRFDSIRYEFDFRGVTDSSTEEKWIEGCLQRNLKIIGLLNYSVPGSLINVFFPEFSNQCVHNQQEAFLDFVRKIVMKYPDITQWEVLNEPNTKRFWIKKPNHKDYLNFLQHVAMVIKSVQTNPTIIFGGLVPEHILFSQTIQERHFYQKCIQAGAAKYFTASNFHPYTFDCYVSFKPFDKMLQTITDSLKKTFITAKKISNHPVWFTEFGISPLLVRIKQKEIAKIYQQSYRFCQSHRIPLFIWQLYDLNKPQLNPLNPEAHFGLLDRNLEPKKTYKELFKLIQR